MCIYKISLCRIKCQGKRIGNNMKISKEILELAEKIKDYRTDIKLVKELNIKKEALEKSYTKKEAFRNLR